MIKFSITASTIFSIIITTFLFVACKKDEDSLPSVVSAKAACLIQKLSFNEGYYTYEYDAEGNPSFIKNFDRYKQISELEVFNDKVATSTIVPANEYPVSISTYYGVGFITTLPDSALVSITHSGVTQTNYKAFFFHHNPKGKLIRIREETKDIPNDYEWELNITYNGQDNVTQLLYELTTDPQNTNTTIVVDGYDDKPMPYAGVKAWKFLMSGYTWDSNPLSVIAALSKNNPLGYKYLVNGVEQERATITYEYNEHGFPTKRSFTNMREMKESTSIESFEYTCQ